MNGVELHFHALPGVDDGPDTIDESVDLLCAAAAEGTGTVVATPHVRGDFLTDVSDLGDRIRELQAAVDAAGLPVLLRRGGELGHDMVGRLTQEDLEAIAQGPPHARWLLVEAPFESMGEDFHAATEELRDRGFGIVLAHPERSAGVLADGAAALRRELAAGALLQVNASSLLGRHGGAPRDAAAELARSFPAAMASDAHGPWKPPSLTPGVGAAIELGVPQPLAHRMANTAPRTLLSSGLRPQPALLA